MYNDKQMNLKNNLNNIKMMKQKENQLNYKIKIKILINRNRLKYNNLKRLIDNYQVGEYRNS